MLYFNYFVLFLLTVVKIVLLKNLIEKKCTWKPTEGEDVVCKPLNDCPWAEKFIEKNGFFPWRCGYENLNLLVCCPVRKTGLISKNMCRRYSSYVYEEMESPTMLPYFLPIKVYICGQENTRLIIGGKVTERHEFPHVVLIGLMKNNESAINWVCGGSILSEYFILTAAHCLNDTEDGVANYVKMGISNRNDKNFILGAIAQRIPHPGYKKPSHYHDIALLKLDRPAPFSPYARPACLYTNPEIPPQRAVVTGWGRTKMNNWNSLSNHLLKLELQIFNHTYCNRSYRLLKGRKLKDGILEDFQFCAGPPNRMEEKDTCPGDSGGPMQIFHRGDDLECMYDVIGIVSFGKPCPSSAGVYVNVSSYIGWIENIVWPHLP